jgi:hypothetical protein
MRGSRIIARLLAAATFVVALGVSNLGSTAIAQSATSAEGGRGQTHALLLALNSSGAHGRALVDAAGRHLAVVVSATGLTAGVPHAMHIHFGADARNECPTIVDDDNGDFRLTTTEGVPAYGPVRVSLTTRGDTSPDSVLAVDRYPTAPEGRIQYHRGIRVSERLMRAIRQGKAVIVIHGVDYNGNGEYDFHSAGRSDLDPDFPAEATDPAVCGRLTR